MNPPPPTLPPPPPPPPPSTAAYLQSHHPNPRPSSPSLPAALSSVSSLLHLSTITLDSLPTPIPTAAASPTLLPCPFNHNHRLPPSYLFSHYLNCPSSVSLQHNFHYPLTLHSSSTTSATDLISLPSSSELSVSLENYVAYNDPANNFFYQSCPGPVTPSIRPPSLLNLPRFLYVECADYSKEFSQKDSVDFSVNLIRFLPSEVWAIRSETEAWGGGFPAGYSCRILRAILRLRDCKLLHLYEWIVVSSPRYGVIIDFAMRDHMVLLVRLCLKVIVREAFGLAGFMFSHGDLEMEENAFSGLSIRTFECPVLIKVMMWLALQFSILYGEVNGKFLAVDVLKECILNSASQASLFPLKPKDAESRAFAKVDVEAEEQVQSIVSTDDANINERGNIKVETVGNSVIFISEVAASVAALHERLLIEEKIKATRNSRPMSAYQRNMEHSHVSKIADDERQKRPDYRPIIEHDGFLWQRSGNQETNKSKTREELLAEERDYKRRRMSYRGKKLKRNTLEVTRDIIEEYMEEIKQAGGIGDMSKSVEETEALASENLKREIAAGVSGSRRNSEIPEENRGRSVDHRKELHSRHDSKDFEDEIQRPRRDSSLDRGCQDLNRNFERIRYDRDDYSRSPDGRKTSSYSRQQMNARKKDDYASSFPEDYSQRSHQRRSKSNELKYHNRNRDEHEHNNQKKERDEHERASSKRKKYEDNSEHGNKRRETDSYHRERDENNGGHGGRRKSRTSRKSRSHYEPDEFEDRYDPAVSHDSYESDF